MIKVELHPVRSPVRSRTGAWAIESYQIDGYQVSRIENAVVIGGPLQGSPLVRIGDEVSELVVQYWVNGQYDGDTVEVTIVLV